MSMAQILLRIKYTGTSITTKICKENQINFLNSYFSPYNVAIREYWDDILNANKRYNCRCFITNPYAALCGAIAPALIVLMVMGIVFIQAFQITPQWQAYDDVYRGRYNLNGEEHNYARKLSQADV